jgi:hypothetical protein
MDEDPKKDAIQWESDDNDPPLRLPASPLADEVVGDVDTAPPEDAYEETEESPSPPLQAVADGFDEADFEKDDQPFELPGAQKMGIVGGKGAGKSYLFQAMVYRTFSGQHAGALTHFLENDSTRIFVAAGESGSERLVRTGAARTLNRLSFIDKYQRWQRLPSTLKDTQKWYRLRLGFRTGWLGRKQGAIDVEFLDASGEGLFEVATLSADDRRIWEKAYLHAGVMIFCLPLWAVFPAADLTDEDWDWREAMLAGFEQVIQHYSDMRSRNNETRPVTTILALTMADDRRSALRTLYDRWISPFLESPHTYLKQLRTGSGVARYLNNARKISDALYEEFGSLRDQRVAGLPQSLDFGRGNPWLVPLSAIDGARLDHLEQSYSDSKDPARLREARRTAPMPIHVELPLLVALCERDNALM